jgi:hypothetical protein
MAHESIKIYEYRMCVCVCICTNVTISAEVTYEEHNVAKRWLFMTPRILSTTITVGDTKDSPDREMNS